MADYITGDAFKDDRVKEKTYGQVLVDEDSSIQFTPDVETPEPMCNTVCLLKTEELNINCKNLVAVSNSYICYIVKKSKLRVIHSSSTKMALLLGHDLPILDLKFSKADGGVLCSVDDCPAQNAVTETTPRVIIWRLDYSNDTVIYNILVQFSFGATVIQPHPHIADVWAVANGTSVGIITGSLGSGPVLQNIQQLSLHANFEGSVVDLSFSADGSMLVVATSNKFCSEITAYLLPPVEFLILGKGKLIPNSALTDANVRNSGVYSIMCLPCGILTASNMGSTSTSNRVIQLNLLSGDLGDTLLNVVQRIKVTLPLHPASDVAKQSRNDIMIGFKNNGFGTVNLIILCDRMSNVLVCFAVDPSKIHSRKRIPICHATFFDLKWPVFSLDTTTIEGRNYYSDDEVEHLEVACYQVQDMKHAVHQYHFNCCSLYSPSEEMTQEFSDRFLESLRVSEKLSIQDVQSLSLSHESPSLPETATLPAPQPTVDISMYKKEEEITWRETYEGDSAVEAQFAIVETPEALPPLPDILRSAPTKGKSIMSMLSNLKAPVTPPPAAAPALDISPALLTVPTASPVSVPVMDAAPSSGRRIEGDSTITITSDAASKDPAGAGVVARFVSGVLGNLFTDAPPANQCSEVVEVEESFEEALLEEEDGEDDWAEASAAVGVTSNVTASVVPPTIVGRDALDLALAQQSSKMDRCLPPVPQHFQVDAALHDKVSDLTRGVLALANSMAEMKSASTASADTALVRTNATESAAVSREENSRAETEKALSAMKRDLLAEMRQMMDASAAKSQREAIARREEFAASSSMHSKEAIVAVTRAVKSVVEAETKKAVEDALKNKAWKDALLSQMVDQMQSELVPILSQKVKETVKDTVRDTVKGALATSFRNAFESSLLPAFQAGTDRMFAQVQASFDQGMKGLTEQARASQECSDECTLEMSREVAVLRSAVAILESKIDELIGRPVGIAAGSDDATPALPDPVRLLQEGSVLEAVECALELRDIGKLVTLLSFMTPTQLVMNCNRLVQLCTAHQLAEDLAYQAPQEGIGKRLEWVNGLIFALLFSGAASQDASAADHLKPVFADIGRFLGTASGSVITQINNWVSTETKNSYVPTVNDFKYLTIAVNGVNFDK